MACLQLLCRAANGLGWAIKNASNSGAQSNSKQKPPQKALNDLGVKRERERETNTHAVREEASDKEREAWKLVVGCIHDEIRVYHLHTGEPSKDGDGKAFLTCKKYEREERKYLNNLLFTDFKVKR